MSSFVWDFFNLEFHKKWLQHGNEAQNKILKIYGQDHFISTLDILKKGKHLYDSSKLLEVGICVRITQKTEKQSTVSFTLHHG